MAPNNVLRAAESARAVQLSPPVAALVEELLHAMGQPLTVLHGLGLLPRLSTGAGTAELMQDMMDQVGRLTEIYRALRTLYDAEADQDSEAAEESSLTKAAERLASDWRRVAGRRGITVTLEVDAVEACEVAVMSRFRAEHVLRGLFDEVMAKTPDGGLIEVTALGPDGAETPDGEVCGLEIRGGEWAAEPVSKAGYAGARAKRGPAAEGGWSRRVIDALVQQGGGRVVYRHQPFAVRLEYPMAATH